MKGPVVAEPRDDMILGNRKSLSPRNNSEIGGIHGSRRGFSARTTTASNSNVESESSRLLPAESSSLGLHVNSTAQTSLLEPLVPMQTTNSSTDLPPLETIRHQALPRGGGSAKLTILSNPHEASWGGIPTQNSFSPGRKHRFKDSSLQNPVTKERPKDAMGVLPFAANGGQIQRKIRDPQEQEQALFEQRLCDDAYGVAVRKINQYGKSNLRYVRCVHIDDLNDGASSKRSLSSFSASSFGRKKSPLIILDTRKDPLSEKSRYALVWGKKKDVQITLDHFTGVRIGKVTERARRNASPASRILSLITDHPQHPALDIEAPTKLDRDKFARAFARFLDVPLEGEDTNSVHSVELPPVHKTSSEPSASSSTPGDLASSEFFTRVPVPSRFEASSKGEPLPVISYDPQQVDGLWQGAVAASNPPREVTSNADASYDGFVRKAVVELAHEKKSFDDGKDCGSDVSSLTGRGYDQELVEELHNALNELRNELDESRAEAARAVKVAEQAIQSAEKTSSQEWQNTVTHKAAEAAAQAQKRSAEAMAKQRLAEERLEGERRNAGFWRKRAEMAEEDAGLLQTRAAAAEVRMAAVEELLESERRIARAQIESMKERIELLESNQLGALNIAFQRNQELEVELEVTRRDLANSKERFEDVENAGDNPRNGSLRKIIGSRKKRADPAITKALFESKAGLSPDQIPEDFANKAERTSVAAADLSKLKVEAVLVRQQYELLRRTTTAELLVLPEISKQFADHVSETLEVSHAEIKRLRERLATESASRRKLLNEVQDLRGIIRVYCRLRPPKTDESVFYLASQEALVLRRDKFSKSNKMQPLSFEVDRIFEPTLPQQDIYGEIQEVCLGVLGGFNVTVMAFGQKGCGKTRSILGEVVSSEGRISIAEHGIQLQALNQLFMVAGRRSERFKDTFSLSIVEVYDERLSDLLAGTIAGEAKGQVISAESSSGRRKAKKEKQPEDDASSGKGAKLEIRCDLHGETVVQGALTVEVESFEEVVRTWRECIENRRRYLSEQEVDVEPYESSRHVFTTVRVTSANIGTGHGVVGKLQFVDMAAAELAPGPTAEEGDGNETGMSDCYVFSNRSLETLSDVVIARSQYVRSVPYRNSTLTHLLRDSLDGDTKVIFLACVSSDPSDIPETTATLRLASRMRQVNIGKATKHSLTSP